MHANTLFFSVVRDNKKLSEAAYTKVNLDTRFLSGEIFNVCDDALHPRSGFLEVL